MIFSAKFRIKSFEQAVVATVKAIGAADLYGPDQPQSATLYDRVYDEGQWPISTAQEEIYTTLKYRKRL